MLTGADGPTTPLESATTPPGKLWGVAVAPGWSHRCHAARGRGVARASVPALGGPASHDPRGVPRAHDEHFQRTGHTAAFRPGTPTSPCRLDATTHSHSCTRLTTHSSPWAAKTKWLMGPRGGNSFIFHCGSHPDDEHLGGTRKGPSHAKATWTHSQAVRRLDGNTTRRVTSTPPPSTSAGTSA